MDSEEELLLLISQVSPLQVAYLQWSEDSKSEMVLGHLASVTCKLVPLVRSMDLDSFPKPESEVISLIKKTISLFKSLSISEPESEIVSLIKQIISLISSGDSDPKHENIISLLQQVSSLQPLPKITVLIFQILMELQPMSFGLESKLKSLITQIIAILREWESDSESQPSLESDLASAINQIVSLGSSIGLESSQKLNSELMSLTNQIISLYRSMIESEQEPELVSLVTQLISLACSIDSDSKPKTESESEPKLKPLIIQLLFLHPEPKLISLSKEVINLVRSMNSERRRLISFSPQVEVNLEEGKFRVTREVKRGWPKRAVCASGNKIFHKVKTGDYTTYFRCRGCNGEDHDGEEYDKAPIEVQHPLHRKHSLYLVLLGQNSRTRECYCCNVDLIGIFYYCPACDYAMNIACVQKALVLAIERPKWHEHTLILFPRHGFLTCDACALADSSSPIYMCPFCDFVVHLRCISLPRVIRMSRHLHRISYTPSFEQGDWSCGVCYKEINNDCGGYSCIKSGCSKNFHSRCATQSNLWDGKELEGEPENVDEEVESFVRISDGIIQHFSHEDHHLKLDDNTSREYDDDKQCQACITPISFGNFYSCMQCEFILHEDCANLPRKRHHPTHPHLLTLVTKHVERIQTMIPNLLVPQMVNS